MCTVRLSDSSSSASSYIAPHADEDSSTAKVKGINALHGAEIYASDLRAGASLIVAGLAASGITCVHNIHFIDRGYEYLEKKLTALGAEISRKCR